MPTLTSQHCCKSHKLLYKRLIPPSAVFMVHFNVIKLSILFMSLNIFPCPRNRITRSESVSPCCVTLFIVSCHLVSADGQVFSVDCTGRTVMSREWSACVENKEFRVVVSAEIQFDVRLSRTFVTLLCVPVCHCCTHRQVYSSHSEKTFTPTIYIVFQISAVMSAFSSIRVRLNDTLPELLKVPNL